MEKLKHYLMICEQDGAISGYICLLVSVGLLIVSFFIPPKGQIDPSVLQGVAELFAFAFLFKLPNIIASVKDGKSLTVQHGNTSLTVTGEKKEKEED